MERLRQASQTLELLDMGFEELADPAGEVGLFEHGALVSGRDSLDMLRSGVGAGWRIACQEFSALIVEVAEGRSLLSGHPSRAML